MTGLPMRRRHVAILIVVVGAVTGFSMHVGLVDWVGSWSQTGAAFETSTRLSYPLIAAAAAWVGSAPRRQRFAHLLAGSSRSRTQVHLLAAVVLASASIVATLPPLLVAGALTGEEATFGQPPLWSIVVVWAGTVAAAGFGLLVGVTTPPVIAAPLSLALVYVVPILADSGRLSLAPLAGLMIADDRVRTYVQTTNDILAIRTLWLLALAWLFVAAASRARNVWLAPFGAVCLLAVPLLLAGQGAMQPIPGAAAEVCERASERVSVCLTRARSHAANEVEEALAPVSLMIAPLGPEGIIYREELLDGADGPELEAGTLIVPFAATNGANGEAHRVDPRDTAVVVVTRVFAAGCVPSSAADARGRSQGTPSDVLQEWALRELGVPTDGTGPLGTPLLGEDFVDWSTVEPFRSAWFDASDVRRAAWLGEHRRQVISCRFEPTDLVL